MKKVEMLEQLFNTCQSNIINRAIDALDDLGYIIERHVTDSYYRDTYKILFNDKKYLEVVIEDASIDIIRYFLFFMIVNYKDRASKVAWCLGKLSNKEYSEGVFRCIDIFVNDNDDITVFYLVKSLCDEYGIENMTQQIVDILIDLSKSKLIETSQFAFESLSFYQENRQFLPGDIVLPISI